MKKNNKNFAVNQLMIVRSRNENNPALIEIKALEKRRFTKQLRLELDERRGLWIDTCVITTIHSNRANKDN